MPRFVRSALIVMVASGLALPAVSGEPSPPSLAISAVMTPAASGWRRTVRGWERPGGWTSSAAAPRWSPSTYLHPVLVAAAEVLLSLAALIGFAANARPADRCATPTLRCTGANRERGRIFR